MHARSWAGATVAVLALAAGATPASAADTGLDAYDVPATAANLKQLRARGFDVAEGRTGSRQEVIATAKQVRTLTKLGVRARLKRDASGRTERERAQRGIHPDGSYDVFRPWFDPTYVGTVGGVDGAPKRQTIFEELTQLVADHPTLISAQEIGRTYNDKPIMAYRVTRDVRDTPRSARPSVLYIATQHAREWITTENIRRQLHHVVEDYGTDPAVTELVNTRELWFVPVANPDGYDFTFTPGNRLWRKNLRELNGTPGTQAGDGVDPNRNYPQSWGLDDEGSSPEPSSETYRGPGPASEPETQAIDRLFKQQDFKVLVNYHSAAELLLYGRGNYVEGTTPDDPIYRALSGTDADSAIKGVPNAPNTYDPDVSAELYTTNGDTDDYTYNRYGALSWTPEMDEADKDKAGPDASVFEYQDVEQDIEAAYEKNLPFMEDVARSADDLSAPDSHLGNTVSDFELHPFTTSYGAPQTVTVNAKRKLGPVRVVWSINGGEEQSAPTQEYKGGERYGGGGVYFHEVRGTVTGAKPGDVVRVSFEAGGQRSGSFRYDQASDTDAPVLLLAAENQKGTSAYPLVAGGGLLQFDGSYAAALTAAGVKFDTWDVDGRGGAPDALGVLSHYKAVVWYTGNDLITRNPGQPGGTGAAKFGNDVTLAVRDYLNDGGKLLFTGQNAAFQNTQGVYGYNPQGEPPYCDAENPVAAYTDALNQCVLLSDDFLQYWVGAYLHADVAGSTGPGDPTRDKADVASRGIHLTPPFGTTAFALDGGTSADNQAHLSTAVTSQSVLGERFKSQLFAGFDGPGAFSPVTGSGYAVAASDDEGWQRLRKTVDLTGATSGELRMKLSHDTEQDFDYVFVEAHTVGEDDWTTLPDANGHTSQSTGQSCAQGGWLPVHPFLTHYQTVNADAEEGCDPKGTTGEWNAATGNSGGYQDWKVDLSKFAGKQVELSVTYAQDQAVSGLGVYVDDVSVLRNGAVADQTSFEGGSLGGFAAGPPPAGSEGGTQGAWKSTGDVGLVTGPGIATADTVYLTFGVEGVREAGQRQAIMDAALRHLGVTSAPAAPAPAPAPAPATPAPGPKSGKPRSPFPTFLLGSFRASRAGTVGVAVRCPKAAGTPGCKGTAQVRIGTSIRGVTKYTLAAGQTKVLRVKLSTGTRRTLARRGKVRVAVRVSNQSGGDHDTVIVVRSATLRAAARK